MNLFLNKRLFKVVNTSFPGLILFLLIFFLPHSSQAQLNRTITPWADARYFAKVGWQDGIDLLNTDRQSLLRVLGATSMYALPFLLLDQSANTNIPPLGLSPFSNYLQRTNYLGGPRVIFPVTSVFILSLFLPDRKFQEAAFTSLESLLIAGGIGYAIKYMTGRQRPESGENPFIFRPFSGNTSFPSGHAITAFAIIVPWIHYYPGPVTYSLTLFSASTAFARLVKDKHWASDVIAGAVLGTMVATWLSKKHLKLPIASFSVAPANNGGTLSFKVKL